MASRNPSGYAKLGGSVLLVSDAVQSREQVTGSGDVNTNPAAIRAQILAAARAGWRVPVGNAGRSETTTGTLHERTVINSNSTANPAAIRAQILAAARTGWRVPVGNAGRVSGERLGHREVNVFNAAVKANSAIVNEKKLENFHAEQLLNSARAVSARGTDAREALPQEARMVSAEMLNMEFDGARKSTFSSLRRADSAYGSMESVTHIDGESGDEMDELSVSNYPEIDWDGVPEEELCFLDSAGNAANSTRKSVRFNDIVSDDHLAEDGVASSKFDTLNFSTNSDYYKLAFVEEGTSDSENDNMWWDDYQQPWSAPSSSTIASRTQQK